MRKIIIMKRTKKQEAGEESVDMWRWKCVKFHCCLRFFGLALGLGFGLGSGLLKGAVAKSRQYTGGQEREVGVSGVLREKEQRVTWTHEGALKRKGRQLQARWGHRWPGPDSIRGRRLLSAGGRREDRLAGEIWRRSRRRNIGRSATWPFAVFTLLWQLRRTHGPALFLKSPIHCCDCADAWRGTSLLSFPTCVSLCNKCFHHVSWTP